MKFNIVVSEQFSHDTRSIKGNKQKNKKHLNGSIGIPYMWDKIPMPLYEKNRYVHKHYKWKVRQWKFSPDFVKCWLHLQNQTKRPNPALYIPYDWPSSVHFQIGIGAPKRHLFDRQFCVEVLLTFCKQRPKGPGKFPKFWLWHSVQQNIVGFRRGLFACFLGHTPLLQYHLLFGPHHFDSLLITLWLPVKKMPFRCPYTNLKLDRTRWIIRYIIYALYETCKD